MSTDVKELASETEYEPEETVEETRNYDRDLIKNTVEEVRTHDRSYTEEDATPPMEQKIQSPELDAVGAESPGNENFEFHEEVESKNRDFRNILKRIADKIRGGGNKIRHAPGNILTKLRRGKIRKAAQVENKYDSDQLEIGN